MHSDFNSSDEEPLILKQVHGVADDSADPNSLLSEETSGHDSSETADGGKEVKHRQRRRKTRRQNDLLRAQTVSLAQALEREENVTEHQARLDNLLSANGLVRNEIYPDGNCFSKPRPFI